MQITDVMIKNLAKNINGILRLYFLAFFVFVHV